MYPHFPTEQELTHSVLSCGDLQQLTEGGRLSFLATFTMEHTQLYCGGILLPELVELYQWLHHDIAHMLTREQASSITIGQVIEFAKKRNDLGNHIRKLYNSIKTNYNQYIELTGGAMVTKANPPTQGKDISDDTPLLYFLTTSGI